MKMSSCRTPAMSTAPHCRLAQGNVHVSSNLQLYQPTMMLVEVARNAPQGRTKVPWSLGSHLAVLAVLPLFRPWKPGRLREPGSRRCFGTASPGSAAKLSWVVCKQKDGSKCQQGPLQCPRCGSTGCPFPGRLPDIETMCRASQCVAAALVAPACCYSAALTHSKVTKLYLFAVLLLLAHRSMAVANCSSQTCYAALETPTTHEPCRAPRLKLLACVAAPWQSLQVSRCVQLCTSHSHRVA